MNELLLEKWKVIPDYPLYEASNKGNIRRVGSSRILKAHVRNSGYLSVHIGHTIVQVHRLIAMAFLVKDKSRKWVNHIDGNRLNNEVTNLEWCTPSENVRHMFEQGHSNISAKKCQVNRFVKKWVIDKTYDSVREAHDDGFDPGSIRKASANGTQYKGYYWHKEHKKIKAVAQYTLNGVFIAEYPGGAIEASKKNPGYDYSCINKVARGEGKRNTYKGYLWKYIS